MRCVVRLADGRTGMCLLQDSRGLRHGGQPRTAYDLLGVFTGASTQRRSRALTVVCCADTILTAVTCRG